MWVWGRNFEKALRAQYNTAHAAGRLILCMLAERNGVGTERELDQAHRERLLREIMNVDGINWSDAHA